MSLARCVGVAALVTLAGLGGSEGVCQGEQRVPPDSGAVTLVRQDPDSARRAIDGLLSRSARVATDSASELIDRADAVSAAYAATWGDSVPYRTVAWFRSSDADTRTAKARVDSLRRLGSELLRTAGLARALRPWRSSLAAAARIADTVGLVAATINIGVGFYTDGQPDSASGYLHSGYRTALIIADYRAAGTAIGTLASVAKDAGDYREASNLYDQALSLHQRVGDSRGLAADYNNIGLVAAAVGDTARARTAYGQALALNRRYDRKTAAAVNLVNLGALADLQGAMHRLHGSIARRWSSTTAQATVRTARWCCRIWGGWSCGAATTARL